jgi:phosphoglycolate phosphatase
MTADVPPAPLVVFDLDGTLVDSSKDLADGVNLLLAELGGRRLPDEAVVRMVGEGASVLVARALAASGVDPAPPDAVSLARFVELYEQRMFVHTRVYPGIPEALRYAASVARLALLTNKPAHETAGMLRGLGLDAFFGDAVVGGDGPLARKPDPAGLRHLMAQLGAVPETTLMVGDSRIDLETARAAGTGVCLARYGFGFRFQADEVAGVATVGSPAELPAAIDRWVDGGAVRPRGLRGPRGPIS